MSFLTKISSIFKASKPEDDFALAESYKNIAGLFLVTLNGGAKITGEQWINREPAFAAGYLHGFGDAIAQSIGRNTGSLLGANIAVQFSKVILEDANSDKVDAFIEYSLNANGHDYEHGIQLGAQDGNGFLNKTSNLPRALVAHFQG